MSITSRWLWKGEVQDHLRETANKYPAKAQDREKVLITFDQTTAEVIISMHSWIRKRGGFNYRDFAKVLWHEILHRNGGPLGRNSEIYTYDEKLSGLLPSASDQGFEEFVIDLVASLRSIDSSNYLLPEVSQCMPQLIDKYGKKIRSVVLWSTGDTETGFQNWKIAKSGLARAFIRGIIAQPTHKAFVEGVHYQVDSRKLQSMAAYIDKWIALHKDEILRLVVIDDSAQNLHMIEDVLLTERVNGKSRGINVRFTPLQVDPSMTSSGAKSKFTKIAGIQELLEPRFEAVLDGAHLFVDFDDTLFKNSLAQGGMQAEQAQVIFDALVRAQRRLSADDAVVAANTLVHTFHRVAESGVL